jgi:hypothetical protein
MAFAAAALLLAAPGALAAQLLEGTPVYPDPAFLEQVPGVPCTPETEHEKQLYGDESPYGDKCKRIRFAFGPIAVKPGQNEAMLNPVTIEKPRYDGFIVRFKPDIARSLDGTKPATENLHLHHATWLNTPGTGSYGDGPFFAAGEEKTIANFPQGYGMETRGSDQWALLYMVHNALATPDVLYITYDIDFVATSDAADLGITPVKPLWLDVQNKSIAPGAPSTGSNPVFNVQKGFGHVDPLTDRKVCAWPDENCAEFDVYGGVTPQQGVDIGENIGGADYTVPASMAGTIVGLGGHLHPGGINVEVSQLRGGVEKPIFISDALYWDYENPSQAGAPPHSWNMSMTVTGAPLDWKVKIKQGDVIRLNAVYDSEESSWYENMGIVVAYVATTDPHGPAGVDVFDDDVNIVDGIPTTSLAPEGAWLARPDGSDGFRPGECTPDLEGIGGTKTLCLRGQVTHGAVDESGNGRLDPCAGGACPPLPTNDGPLVSEIRSVAFRYGEADMGIINATGIPRVKKGEPVRLWNYDTAARIWHTYTRCKEPCTGPTLINYPIANGGNGTAGDPMDFESMEIGYGLFWEPSKSQVGPEGYQRPNQKWVENGLFWDFTPAETGTYSFYCRIHPGMRGAFKVVD